MLRAIHFLDDTIGTHVVSAPCHIPHVWELDGALVPLDNEAEWGLAADL